MSSGTTLRLKAFEYRNTPCTSMMETLYNTSTACARKKWIAVVYLWHEGLEHFYIACTFGI